jgi:8-oxo-dGTP pyrophosphatase MutT (NUDIX family)
MRAARQKPSKPRQPLLLACDADAKAVAGKATSAGVVVGSVEPQVLLPLRGLMSAHGQPLLSCAEPDGQAPWVVHAATAQGWDDSLALLAQALRDQGHAGPWRNEALAVRGPDGQVLARLERGLVRVLGVATHAVHLVCWVASVPTTQGRVFLSAPEAELTSMWVQQRAMDKPNDPGLWDTTMGGMVPASDSLHEALGRETWEEAGLHLDQLQGLRHGGQVRVQRPSEDGLGTGYMVEHIDWFEAALPKGLEPKNQDGEVAQFCDWTSALVLQRLEQGDFTLEACLVLAQALELELELGRDD